MLVLMTIDGAMYIIWIISAVVESKLPGVYSFNSAWREAIWINEEKTYSYSWRNRGWIDHICKSVY